MLKQQRVTNAYNTVLSALRQARDNAVAQRTSYVVTFDNTTTPHKVVGRTHVRGIPGSSGRRRPMSCRTSVSFSSASGHSHGKRAHSGRLWYRGGSDRFRIHRAGYRRAGGQKSIYFCPDGSAQDAAGGAGQCAGNWNNGVVYIARPGDLMSSRAITVWGATGRIRGWRLYNNGAGGITWQRQ